MGESSNFLSPQLIVPIISTLISGVFLVIVARINKQNQPVKDLIKKTKIEGNGSLVEALGILQKEYRDSQTRHAEELTYYIGQLSDVRKEVADLRGELAEKDGIIEQLRQQVAGHERRMNESHVGEGQ